jgi:hypothetical protein
MLEPWTAIVLFDVGIGRRTDELARLMVVGVERANVAIAKPNADAVAAQHDLGPKAWRAIVHEHGGERILEGLCTVASPVLSAVGLDRRVAVWLPFVTGVEQHHAGAKGHESKHVDLIAAPPQDAKRRARRPGRAVSLA